MISTYFFQYRILRKAVKKVLQINNKKSNGGYSASIAAQYVSADLPLINVTQRIEEVQQYDRENHQYLEKLDHTNIYACQNVGDFVQNPIKIKVTGSVPRDLKFGQNIKVKGLVACRIRNKGYTQVFFKADNVEILRKEGDKNVTRTQA